MKKMGAALAAVMMMLSLAACSQSEDTNYNLECDRGDQAEHDRDCGYIDDNGQWQWYSWVVLGDVRTSPDNWEPPAGVSIEQEDSDHSHKKSKPKKTKSPKPRVTTKR